MHHIFAPFSDTTVHEHESLPFFRNHDYSHITRAFAKKGWNMWLKEPKRGCIEVHKASISTGVEEGPILLDPYVLSTYTRQRAIEWLELFANDADDISI